MKFLYRFAHFVCFLDVWQSSYIRRAECPPGEAASAILRPSERFVRTIIRTWIMDYLNGAYFLFEWDKSGLFMCDMESNTYCNMCSMHFFRHLNSLFGNFEAFVQSLHFHPKQIAFIERSRRPPATWLTGASACKCS